ncbi:MAG: nitroreductase [Anaerolineaceae bacterium]|nr:nitroreductase [Anaerolineaceae bacterium]
MFSPISKSRLLKDGTLINAGITAVIFSSLYVNPEIWVHDAPPDIQEKFGPKSRKAKWQTILFGVPFMLILFGGVVHSTRQLKQQMGGHLPFKMAFWHAYGLLLYFWLFDLVIIDWLWLVTFKPSFALIPGTEGMAGYDNYSFHLKAALPALPGMAIPALIIAFFIASGKSS